MINIGIRKALNIPQDELRSPKQKSEDRTLAFVSTFNPNNPNVFHLMKTALTTLKENKVRGFKNIKLVHGKRQGPNLKKILTKAEFKTRAKIEGVFKCGDKRCKCCDYLLLDKSYTFKHENKTIELRSKMTCDSSNLIYVIICPTCKEEYIGETGDGTTTLRVCTPPLCRGGLDFRV